MKIVAVCPMKLNSVRLPNKNVLPFKNGKPLCYYILKTLLSLDLVSEVYVYCSNADVKRYLQKGVRYLKRSAELDTDKTRINEVLQSFANDVPADIYAMTHATAPFVKKSLLNKELALF